jgi:hypothetical protein
MPDEPEVPQEVTTMFNVAIGYFPQATAPNSQAVRVLWGAQLWPRFTVDDVCYALARLATFIGTDQDPKRRQRRESFPDLGEVIDAADEEKRKREIDSRPKLTARDRKHGSIDEQLAAFDTYAGRRLVGPYEGRVRELIAAGAFQGGSAAEAFAKLQPFTYQVGNSVLTRAFSDTPPPIPQPEDPPAEVPGDLLTPEHVSEIVDAWQMGEEIDVSAMSMTLRTACRTEAERRRQGKLQEATP